MRTCMRSFVVAVVATTILSLTSVADVMAINAAPDNVCQFADIAQARPAAAAGATSQIEVPKHIVEQYKAYVGDLAALGSQLASTQTFYLTFISGLIAVLTLKEAGRPIREVFAGVSIVVFLAIAIISINWYLTELRFADLFRTKFVVLCDMERSYYGLLFPMFAEQSQLYLRDRSGIIEYQLWLILLAACLAFGLGLFGIILQFRRSKPAPLSSDAVVSMVTWSGGGWNLFHMSQHSQTRAHDQQGGSSEHGRRS